MRLHAVKMLQISITTDPKEKVLEEMEKYLLQNSKFKIQNSKKDKKPVVIVTPNPEQVVLAQKDTHFRQLLNRADVALPDGVGLVWASRLVHRSSFIVHGDRIQEVIPGIEFMEDLVALAAKRGFPMALIGGRQGVAVEAFECLRRKHPGLQGWGEDGPEIRNNQYNDYNGYNFYKKIRETNTRIVFVGLGAPKQEMFIEQLARQLSFRPPSRNPERKKLDPRVKPEDDNWGVILMSVGGAFDELSGRIPRAPGWIRAIGLKWLWRLILEPWRVKRQLALLEFIWLVFKERSCFFCD